MKVKRLRPPRRAPLPKIDLSQPTLYSSHMAEVIIVDPEFFLQRRREKAASRAADQARIDAGEDPEVLQKENSIFPEDFFKGAKISNLAETVGR